MFIKDNVIGKTLKEALAHVDSKVLHMLNNAEIPDLVEIFDEDYESLYETDEEWQNEEAEKIQLTKNEYSAMISELKEHKKI